jgi:hypothetical protein
MRHDGLLKFKEAFFQARALSDGVKDREATAQRRWGSRFSLAVTKAEAEALRPIRQRKWWGPVVLEAGAVPVPPLDFLIDRERL